MADETAAPASEAGPEAEVKDAKFGMFKGVFTPSILTILGVIMYLRFGWVVGSAGLIGSLVVVLFAHFVSIATGMSISSIATNRTVKAGGDYYMISRSLGLPIGGAIGIALFFALALSMSLYVLGFTESFLDALGFENSMLARRLVGSLAVMVLTALTFFSTSLALKIQYFVLAAIALSLVSLFFGTYEGAAPETIQLWFSDDGPDFAVVFGVFFPAVTGFTAGVALSGDLKNPRTAIPRGTMLAIGVGLLVYLIIPIFFAFKIPAEILRVDQGIWNKVAMVPALVVAGVFAATLSSALGSILGAPRYLQALANDGILPRFLGKGHGVLNEPRVGTIATFIIAEMGILVGELDLVARIITMFFLTSYGFICLASGIETWVGTSSYRPHFKTPVWVSLLGALLCFGLMFKLDMLAMIGATVVMAMIFALLKRREFRGAPGDRWGGFWSAVVQAGILHLHRKASDAMNWRPNVVVFGSGIAERPHLLDLSTWIVQNRGLNTAFYVIEGSIAEQRERSAQLEKKLREAMARSYPDVLSRVGVYSSVYDGIKSVAQSYGLAGMLPNTILMGWGEQTGDPGRFTDLVGDLIDLDHNILLLRHDGIRSYGEHKSIDIWWGGLERNGALMMVLAYLLSSSDAWQGVKVRINVLVDDEAGRAETMAALTKVIADSRMRFIPNVIIRTDPSRPIPQVIAEESKDADFVMLGLRPPGADEGGAFVERISEMFKDIPTVLLVRASSAFDGSRVLYDDVD